MSKPWVAAFDLATSTGVCLGRVSDPPCVTTWDLREAGPSRSRRFLRFSNLCDALFEDTKVDFVRYEAPVRIAAFGRQKDGGFQLATSEDTITFLRGLIAILECSAARADIKDIQSFDVQSARGHLIGQRTFRKERNGLGKSEAKARVMKMAAMLGVKCDDDNQGDAYCGWSYTCALLNPRTAHLVTPLFQSAARSAAPSVPK